MRLHAARPATQHPSPTRRARRTTKPSTARMAAYTAQKTMEPIMPNADETPALRLLSRTGRRGRPAAGARGHGHSTGRRRHTSPCRPVHQSRTARTNLASKTRNRRRLHRASPASGDGHWMLPRRSPRMSTADVRGRSALDGQSSRRELPSTSTTSAPASARIFVQ
jgi:hypothetical protein